MDGGGRHTLHSVSTVKFFYSITSLEILSEPVIITVAAFAHSLTSTETASDDNMTSKYVISRLKLNKYPIMFDYTC